MSRFFEWGRRASRIGWLVALAALGGCAGSNGTGEGPRAPALEKRDVEIEHEDCDLESSSAKGIDANADGRADLIRVYSGDREVCRAVDINMDTVVDVFIYYDDAGRERRRESGFDRDTRPDEIAFYEAGVLVRKERETNNDAKIDTWSHYQGGKLVSEERDSTGDGYVDQWWTYPSADCAKVVSDGNGDGKPDEDSEIEICKPGAGKPAAPPKPKPEEPAPEADDDDDDDDGPKVDDGADAYDEDGSDASAGEPSSPDDASAEGEDAP